MTRLFCALLTFCLALIHAPLLQAATAQRVITCGPEFDQMIKKSDFYTDRGAFKIANSLPMLVDAVFVRALLELGPDDLFVDFGGGQGGVGKSYLADRAHPNAYFGTGQFDPLFHELYARPWQDRARYVNITYSTQHGPQSKPFKLPMNLEENLQALRAKYNEMKGRFFEQIPQDEIPRAKVALDFYGLISYGKNPTVNLQRELDLLLTGGTLIALTGGLIIHTLAGESLTLIEWLKQVLDPACTEFTADTSSTGFAIKKKCDQITLPKATVKDVTLGTPNKYVLVEEP